MNPFYKKISQYIVIIVSLGLCLSAARTIVDLWHRRDVIGLRQKDLTTITRENQKLEQRLKETQNSDYIERIARDKLGMVKDGETIILLPESGVRSQAQAGTIPHWKKWWRLFF